MAVGSGTPYNIHTGTGAVTVFAYGFTLLDAGDLVVTLDGVETSAYTVQDVGEPDGGTVTFNTAPASGVEIILRRVIALVRTTDYQNNGDLRASVVNNDHDREWMAIQQLADAETRSVRAPFPETIPALPSAAARAGRLLSFDDDGNPAATAPTEGTATALAVDLASTASATKGAGMSGYSYLRAYPMGTVGDKLNSFVTSRDFGAVGDYDIDAGTGTDDTAAIQAAINWCAANKRRLLQVGISKITSPLTWPSTQIEIVGAGAVRTFDSGWAYTGTGTMVSGSGADKTLYFTTLSNMVFEGPGIASGVNGFYGDFYQGGARGCIFRNWNRAVECFGTLNTFEHNRFLENVEGLVVTNWPTGSSQAGVPTTTFLSRRNSYYGNTGYGLKCDTSDTGGENFVSSASIDDVFEQNGVGLYLNKTFAFLLENPHFELHATWAIQSINSNPTIVQPYIGSGDSAKISITFPGASANAGGYNQIDYNGLRTRAVTLGTTGSADVGIGVDDGGKLLLSGAGIVGTWTPTIGSSGGTSSGNTYSVQQGDYTRIGALCICTFRVVLSAKDAGMSGVVQIAGLPFPADAAKANRNGNPLLISGVTLNGGAYTGLMCDVTGSLAYPAKVGSGLAPDNLAPADLSSTAELAGTLIYLTE